MAKILSVNNIKKYYQMGDVEVRALDGISFDIHSGEFVVILGPSGSGKSTLLNIIGGMDNPTDGTVTFKDRDITNYNEKELTYYRRNDIGFVFQFYNLIPNLTARENVELATEVTKNSLNIEEVFNAVDLSERIDYFPSQMSGGQQQRVAIARAVSKNPEILLCDEPTGALDFETGISILELLSKVNKEFKKTVIVITHNAGIAKMADRVIKTRNGKIIENYINENPISAIEIEW
ncbi:MAG TPA: macrolide ABC transporter ATP-binding protein [Clostridiales bacterium]|nr:MAG: macrolide ABC transporter ATP-binding protein [Clostridiales bacterium GWD2_32_59]HAN10557.1 macrolide ABC transporter ATP-binding protein [Clostridiales bacterium]